MSSTLDAINNWVASQDGLSRTFPGLVLRWTGFKAWPNNSLLVGQWLATPTDESTREAFTRLPGPSWSGRGESGEGTIGVYSSTPGSLHPYRAGDTFDIAIEPGQIFLQVADFDSDPKQDRALAVGMKACEDARERLEAYLRHHGILDA